MGTTTSSTMVSLKLVYAPLYSLIILASGYISCHFAKVKHSIMRMGMLIYLECTQLLSIEPCSCYGFTNTSVTPPNGPALKKIHCSSNMALRLV